MMIHAWIYNFKWSIRHTLVARELRIMKCHLIYIIPWCGKHCAFVIDFVMPQNKFGERLISEKGPFPWPSKSPDLTPPNFSVVVSQK